MWKNCSVHISSFSIIVACIYPWLSLEKIDHLIFMRHIQWFMYQNNLENALRSSVHDAPFCHAFFSLFSCVLSLNKSLLAALLHFLSGCLTCQVLSNFYPWGNVHIFKKDGKTSDQYIVDYQLSWAIREEGVSDFQSTG